jgi:hypothetical protein
MSVRHSNYEWKTAYRRYREIERAGQVEEWVVHSAVASNQDVTRLLAQLTAAGYEIPTDDILDEVIELQGLRRIASEISPGPFDDVYQAALAFVGDWGWWSRPDEEDPQLEQITHLYRGQRRDDWQVIPKLLRVEPSQPSFTREEIRHRIRRAHGFSMLLKERDSSLSDGEAMAIAQHYSEEACLGTWLIDVTFDPWTALFFASLGGQANDTGKVEWILVKEWGELSAGGKNPLGALRLYKPSNVQRIEAQRALFVEAPHPLLWEQYIPFGIRFRQQDGLVFEDPQLGVTRSMLLPTDDPLKSVAESFGAASTDYPDPDAATLPINLFVDPLSGWTYLRMLRSWLPERASRWQVDPLPSSFIWVLPAVCEFHARLQAPEVRDKVGRTQRSLNRLSETIDSMLRVTSDGEELVWTGVLHSIYLNRSIGEESKQERHAVESVLGEVEAEYSINGRGP